MKSNTKAHTDVWDSLFVPYHVNKLDFTFLLTQPHQPIKDRNNMKYYCNFCNIVRIKNILMLHTCIQIYKCELCFELV